MMHRPAYSPLAHDEVRLLRASENEELRDTFLTLVELLSGTVAMFSETYPRPLYVFPDEDPARIVAALQKLRGTPFHDRVARNVQAAAAIRRMWEERGHTDELHEAADAYLDALNDDYAAVTVHPDVPRPAHPSVGGESRDRRRMAGGA